MDVVYVALVMVYMVLVMVYMVLIISNFTNQ